MLTEISSEISAENVKTQTYFTVCDQIEVFKCVNNGIMYNPAKKLKKNSTQF